MRVFYVPTRHGLSRPTASKSPASFPAKPYNYIICIFDRIIGFSGEFRFSRPDKVLHRLLDIASQLDDQTPSSFWLHHTELRTKPFYSSPPLAHATVPNNTLANGFAKSNWVFTGYFSRFPSRTRLNKSCPNKLLYFILHLHCVLLKKKKVRYRVRKKNIFFVEKKKRTRIKNFEYRNGTGCRQAAPSKEMTNARVANNAKWIIPGKFKAHGANRGGDRAMDELKMQIHPRRRRERGCHGG